MKKVVTRETKKTEIIQDPFQVPVIQLTEVHADYFAELIQIFEQEFHPGKTIITGHHHRRQLLYAKTTPASQAGSINVRNNAAEIEAAISLLAEQPFVPADFPYAFLEVFGHKPTTISRPHLVQKNIAVFALKRCLPSIPLYLSN